MTDDVIVLGTLLYVLVTVCAFLLIGLWHKDARNRRLWHRKVGETGARRACIVLLVWRSTPILRSETKSFVEWLRTEREDNSRF